jgi:hypothetical protein
MTTITDDATEQTQSADADGTAPAEPSETAAPSPGPDNSGIPDNTDDNMLASLGALEVEKPEFEEDVVERATEHFNSIGKLIENANARLVPQAVALGREKFTARGWLMRLDWAESTERTGFYDSPADIWPADRRPDHTQLRGAALILWHWLEQGGYEPYLERSHCQVLACEDHNVKPVSGDFRGYFFYIGIHWTVNLVTETTATEPTATGEGESNA